MKPFILFVCFSAFMAATSGAGVVDPSLKKRFLGGGGDSQNVMVSFNQDIQTVIEKIGSQNFSSMAERRTALTNAQKAFTDAAQKPLQGFLQTMGVQSQSFWINNKMIIPNANSGLVNAISSVPGVAKIEKEPVVEIKIPFEGQPEELDDVQLNMTRVRRQSSAEWGVRKIRADQIWPYHTGKGIVVAGIDTGVRYTHQNLRNNWRSNYGWYDPYQKTSLPNDQNGHGTHTIGTIAGTGGIGVAPDATWIACKGCSDRSCSGQQLFDCGQWVQCPYKPDGSGQDCNWAPDVVSNSWGGGQGESWYDGIIRSWQAAGIVPVFSIGNSGPDCGTAGSPGDRQNVIAVGSMDQNDRISSFSSLGPDTKDGRVKPDIAAPGGQIRSAWYTSDRAFNTISGTSMACPHVAGVVALMLERSPNLSYNQIYNVIAQQATRSGLDTSTAKTCGGRGPNNWPNNVFGYGRIDAYNSVASV